MRYNMLKGRSLATVVLSDTLPWPTGMYIIGADSSEEQTIATEDLAESSSLASWVWRVGVESMLVFPKKIHASELSQISKKIQRKST